MFNQEFPWLARGGTIPATGISSRKGKQVSEAQSVWLATWLAETRETLLGSRGSEQGATGTPTVSPPGRPLRKEPESSDVTLCCVSKEA